MAVAREPWKDRFETENREDPPKVRKWWEMKRKRQDPAGLTPRGLVLNNNRQSWQLKLGSGGRTRTYDQVVNSHPLCQLSYAGITELPAK